MLNRKYFPFQRNNYYYGKLLTARDFEDEQRYFNDKRRLANRLTGANGIVAGLGVIRADDASLVIQAGCATDAAGREIVVPATRVVKLSTIEGFAQLASSSALLGIRYDEQPAEEMYAVMDPSGDTALTLSNFAIRRGDETFAVSQNLEIPLKPVDCSIEERYLADYYEKSMDTELEESYDERLWLARVRLIRQGSSVIIDRVEPAPWGQYSYNAQQLMTLRRLEEFYPGRETAAAPAAAAVPAAGARVTADRPEPARSTACGVFDFPLGMGAGKGPLFSDEIMHGLGPGPVCVQVGVEYITSDANGNASGEVLFGDASLFAADRPASGAERVYQVTTGVKVLPERGTFVVGLRLGEETGLISLRIRWFAFRAGEIDKQFQPHRAGEPMLLVNPDTIVLQPKSTAHIAPVFINMPSEACNFSIKDPEGGSIDNNGTYTAPAREGVYEIRVEAVSDPSVYTYAFAIVSQKKKETAE